MGLKAFSKDVLLSEKAIVIYFILIKLILCLYPFEYGYFRDELYYIALSDNVDFGYVDVPPIVPFLLAGVRSVLGTSFFSLHLLPALSGALVVWLVALMVKKMGGSRGAMVLALTCVTLAPVYLCFENMYTYDVFDKLCWTLMLYVVVLLLKGGEGKYWIYFGIIAGIGLMTKITIAFLGFGILSGLLMSSQRKHVLSRQFWLGGLIALVVFSPYILWEVRQGLPSLEYYGNYAAGKTWPATPLEFIKNQIVMMNFLAFGVWFWGLCYFLFSRRAKEFRALGYAYIVVLAVCMILKLKFYLLAPFYTVLFAGGAVAIEEFSRRPKFAFLTKAPAAAILLLGLVHVPFVRPVAPIDFLIEHSGMSVYMGIRGERCKLGRLHQHFADRFGWEEMAASVAKAYWKLSAQERAKACVLAGNYGEAGAIWVFGERWNLPRPVSGHLQYFIWGPRGYSGEVVISIGISLQTLEDHFGSVKRLSSHRCLLAMGHERVLSVYVCRDPKEPLEEMWPCFKNMD